jgi:WS/DGAT/MGAT family acyltransferase
MSTFDRSRPLWEFTLVEHVEGDRAALVMKHHHSLTDGIGGIQLALLLFDTERGAHLCTTQAEAPARERINTPELIRQSIAWDWGRAAGFIANRTRSAMPSAMQTARHPLIRFSDALETSRSMYRTVAPVRETLSPIMKHRSLGRHLDMVEVQLDDLKRAAASCGGSVNDGFIASITAGLRRYHERKGSPVEKLRVTLPISIRKQDDPMGGNRITLVRFAVPVSEPDPARRIPEIHRLCESARNERSLAFTNSIAGTLNLLPPGVVGSMLKHVDFLASDVPGFPFPVYLGGARLERYMAFGPTIGSSVNLTLMSYNGRCCVGVTMDTAALPDYEVFVECLREGFEEVLALGGDHEAALLPLHDLSLVGK